MRRGEIQSYRCDPFYHWPRFTTVEQRLRTVSTLEVGEIASFSNETWKPDDNDLDVFRYIEISGVDRYTGAVLPVDTSTSEAPSRARMVVREGDVIVSLTRPHHGSIALIDDRLAGCIASTGFSVLRGIQESKCGRRFLVDALRSSICLDQMLRRSSGGNYPAITEPELARICVPTPSLDVQRRLVAELDVARAERDRALAEADRLLASIDEMVKQMLGLPDLDLPRQASYAIRLSTAKAASTLSADYFHPERLQAIKLIQRLPNAPLSRLVDFRRDIIKSPGVSRYIGLASVASGTGQLTDATENAAGQCFAFSPGDVLYGRLRPYLNKVWLATFEGVSSTEFHVMRPFDADSLRPEYLAVVMRTSLIVAQTKHMMTGNTHPRIANEDVVNLLLPLADPATQSQIVEATLARQAECGRLRAHADATWREARERFEHLLLQGGTA